MKTKDDYVKELRQRVKIFEDAFKEKDSLTNLYASDIANVANAIAEYDEYVENNLET